MLTLNRWALNVPVAFALAALGSVFLAGSAQAELMNEDFSSGLDSWTTTGDVSAPAGTAILGDSSVIVSQLYQGSNVGAGTHTLQFDFLNELSSFEPTGGFPDFVSINIYLIDDLGTFDLDNLVFDDVVALTNMDFNGPTGAVNGTIGPSSLGGNWQLFSVTFNSSFQYAIPTFELFGLNFEDGDSMFQVDNVRFVDSGIIPEPATLSLLAGGLALLGIRRRMQRK